MIFRLIVICAMGVLAYYLLRAFKGKGEYENCKKCDGIGYWRATRGEKEKCDICWGSGKKLRNQ